MQSLTHARSGDRTEGKQPQPGDQAELHEVDSRESRAGSRDWRAAQSCERPEPSPAPWHKTARVSSSMQKGSDPKKWFPKSCVESGRVRFARQAMGKTAWGDCHRTPIASAGAGGFRRPLPELLPSGGDCLGILRKLLSFVILSIQVSVLDCV